MSVRNILDGTIPITGGLTPESEISVKHVYADLGLNTPGDVVVVQNMSADYQIYGAEIVANRVKLTSYNEREEEALTTITENNITTQRLQQQKALQHQHCK